MDLQNPIEDTTALLRQALPLMSKHSIPITPPNYAVWYTYVSGSNPTLQEEIAAIIAGETGFSEETNNQLAEKYGLGSDAAEIKKMRMELTQTLITILQEISELTGKTGNFESSLSKSVDLLTQELSFDELKTLMDHILAETKIITAHGKATQKRMQTISTELKVMRKNLEQAQAEAAVDFLTGLANRKSFDKVLGQMVYKADTLNEDLSLLIIDIDHFKRFNDEHGHVVGDEVLKFVAQQIKKHVRGNDFVARFGGEEFAVLLPGTHLVGAKVVAENIRQFFSITNLKTSLTSNSLGRITVSIGAACRKDSESLDQFIMRADSALYHAKDSGRDRVCVTSPNASK